MTEEVKNEEGLAAIAGAEGAMGEDITQEQMEAEGASNMSEADVQAVVEKLTKTIEADHVAAATRGLAQGIMAALSAKSGKPIAQDHPVVRIVEPSLDLLYFVCRDIGRMAAALEGMQAQQESMIRELFPKKSEEASDASEA